MIYLNNPFVIQHARARFGGFERSQNCHTVWLTEELQSGIRASLDMVDGLAPDRAEKAEIARLARDLAEALTALSHYLGVADRILVAGTKPEAELLRDILKKSMGQYERAADATRQLRELCVDDTGGNDL